jgi:hypothetical protein
VLIEYDRTERPHKQVDRLRRYDRWLLDGWRKSHFAAYALPPAVIFLTAREGPLSRLIETADETFSAWHGGEHSGPREGTHPARERVVFSSRERVLAGDWMMRRTPSLPPALREQPAVCRARLIEYDLPSLLADAQRIAASIRRARRSSSRFHSRFHCEQNSRDLRALQASIHGGLGLL